MATHRHKSKIADLRRPSGGLGGIYNGVEIDWEPGDPPITMHPAMQPIWGAIARHMTIHTES